MPAKIYHHYGALKRCKAREGAFFGQNSSILKNAAKYPGFYATTWIDVRGQQGIMHIKHPQLFLLYIGTKNIPNSSFNRPRRIFKIISFNSSQQCSFFHYINSIYIIVILLAQLKQYFSQLRSNSLLREVFKFKNKTVKKRSGWPLGLTSPPSWSGQGNVKYFDFDFWLKFMIIYDLKLILPKKYFFTTENSFGGS